MTPRRAALALLGVCLSGGAPRPAGASTGGLAYEGRLTLGAPPPLEQRQQAVDLERLEPRFGGALLASLYRPAFSNAPELYATYFGDQNRLLTQVSGAWHALSGPLSLSLSATLGFWQAYGRSRTCTSGAGVPQPCDRPDTVYVPGNDATSLNLLPLTLGLDLRLTWLKRGLGVPLVPYLRGELLYTFWWVWTEERLARNAADQAGIGGVAGLGASAGLAFNLDFVDQVTARHAYLAWGLVDSYLFIEYSYHQQDNFRASSLDLGGRYWTIGIAADF